MIKTVKMFVTSNGKIFKTIEEATKVEDELINKPIIDETFFFKFNVEDIVYSCFDGRLVHQYQITDIYDDRREDDTYVHLFTVVKFKNVNTLQEYTEQGKFLNKILALNPEDLFAF